MPMHPRRAAAALVFALISLPVSPSVTRADGLKVAPVNDPKVAKECSACHMLYPAGLLPSKSWEALMGNLKNHFGDNAELDEANRQHITAYLLANAADASGRGGKLTRDTAGSATPMRISETPWFIRKHNKKGRISPETLKRHGAKSPADCQACHKAAEKGLFDDD